MKKQLTQALLIALFMPFASRAQSAREGLVAAENAFATQAAKTSTEAAFLGSSTYTALVTDDGKLANAQEVWRVRPTKPGSHLTWYPVLADVAQSGELGYTTGPWALSQNDKPQSAGEYVTVWRKQPDGQWKFVVNMGVERIGIAPARSATVPGPQLMAGVGTPSVAPSGMLLDLDRKFAVAELLKPGATYQQYLSSEVRLYRPGLSTMHGIAASANMKTLDGGYLFTATNGYLAAAGDLGYVVGTLRRAAAGTKHPEENGSYLRIWRREAVSGWRLVLEIFNLVPNPVVGDASPAAPATGERATGAQPSKRG